MAETPTPSEVLAAYRRQLTEHPEQLVAANVPYTSAYYQDLHMRTIATEMAQKALFGDYGTGTLDEHVAVYDRVQELIRPEETNEHKYDAHIEQQYQRLSPLISTIQAQRIEDSRQGIVSRQPVIQIESGMMEWVAATPRPRRTIEMWTAVVATWLNRGYK